MGGCLQSEKYVENGKQITCKEKYKTLLLGSEGSGKSTIFKQVRNIYGGFTVHDRKVAKQNITLLVIEIMQSLLEVDEELYDWQMDMNENFKVAARNICSIRLNGNVTITNQIAKDIEILWKVQIVKKLFASTAYLSVYHKSFAYYFDNIHRISLDSYQLTDKDILMAHGPTTGFREQCITHCVDRSSLLIFGYVKLFKEYIPPEILKLIDAFFGFVIIRKKSDENENFQFQFVDVGASTNERRKWIHHFEDVCAVIYIVSLASYDERVRERVYEDETVNSMLDAIRLFKTTMNDYAEWLNESNVFLIFTKKDIFQQHIINKSMLQCFNEKYDEEQYFNQCKTSTDKINRNIKFIKKMFMDQIEIANTFTICSYDDQEIRIVFDHIFSIIVQKHLQLNLL